MDSSQQQHAKVERFLKLGYSQGDIVRVLQSLGHDAQTNDILEELIKTCHTPAYSNHSLQNSPKLVSRGCSPAPPTHNTRQPDREAPLADFRPVVIDGSNVAMSHGDKKVFSCRGLQLAVNWFMNKGLRDITVFVPLWRKEQPRPEAPITDQNILHELERRKILVYTPSRCVNGKRVVCYDDRYIIKLAFDSDGIVVSNDNYRDLQNENPQWKKFIEERLLMYTFANDKFMPPDDPLGRNGPTIDDFLRRKPWTTDNKPQHCPYGKKCTYGVKCKFYHPERVNQSQLSVADELRALRDRAKNISPKASLQDTHCPAVHLSSSPSPPPGSPHHHRDSSSPRSQQPNVSLHHGHSSSDLDEAFSSMDSSLSRLYIQDVAYSMGQPLHSYSSGVASYSISQDDYSLPGSRQCRSAGAYYPNHTGSVSSQCRCGHQQTSRLSQCQPPAWGSCPALLPHNTAHVSEKQFFRPDRQGHSLPRDPWSADRNSPREQWSADRNSPREQWSSDTQSPREQWSSGSHSPREQWSSGSHSPREQWSADRNSPREQWSSDRHSPREQWSSDTQSPREQWSSDRHSPRESWLQGSRTNSPSSEQRTGLRSQLSTLFPPSVVEQVMSAYPHVSDMSQLISLIQSYRTSLISY